MISLAGFMRSGLVAFKKQSPFQVFDEQPKMLVAFAKSGTLGIVPSHLIIPLITSMVSRVAMCRVVSKFISHCAEMIENHCLGASLWKQVRWSMLPKEQKLARGAGPDVGDLWATGMQHVLCWVLKSSDSVSACLPRRWWGSMPWKALHVPF